MRRNCDQFSADLPSGWIDTTEDPWPFTLAKPDGVGALQFSVAVYCSGQAPAPTIAELSGLLSGFARDRSLGKAVEHFQQDGRVTLVASSFHPDADTFIRAWYLSDGLNVAKVTYTCHQSDVGSELNEAEHIVRSFEFSRMAPNSSFEADGSAAAQFQR